MTASGMLRVLLFVVAVAVPGAASAPVQRHTPEGAVFDSAGYRLAVGHRTFAFPRDHAAHEAYRIEWWYYTGHLEGRGRHFGYELTFFRVGIDRAREASRSAWAAYAVCFAHFAVTDEDRGRFLHHERIQRPALGMAGADTARYRVWVDDWEGGLLLDGRTHHLVANADDAAITLDLTPLGPPVLHGRDGLSAKSATPGNASWYYSIPRLDTRGFVRIEGDSIPVRGLSWMDHEFGTTRLEADQAGWDWFGLQLDDGAALMLYRLRGRDGSVDSVSAGTWVAPDGSIVHLARDDVEVRATGRWKSPHSDAVYPQGWTVRVPSQDLELEITPTVADQELYGGGTGGVVYWEGSVRIRGTRAGETVRGRGYVELTGYAGAPPGL